MAEQKEFKYSLRGRAACFMTWPEKFPHHRSLEPSENEISDCQEDAGRRWHCTQVLYQGDISLEIKCVALFVLQDKCVFS